MWTSLKKYLGLSMILLAFLVLFLTVKTDYWLNSFQDVADNDLRIIDAEVDYSTTTTTTTTTPVTMPSSSKVDEKKKIKTQHIISTNLDTTNTRSINNHWYLIQVAAETAQVLGFGNCGNENYTSLEQTSQRFGQYPPILILDDHPDSNDDDDGKENFGNNKSNTSFYNQLGLQDNELQLQHEQVMIQFQAFDTHGIPRLTGGDEFVMTFYATGRRRSSSEHNYNNNNKTITHHHWKMATTSIDLLNGTYAIIVKIPSRINTILYSFHLTLHHYYTCHEGFLERYNKKQPFKNPIFHHTLEEESRGSSSFVIPHDDFFQIISNNKTNTNNNNNNEDNINRKPPYCDASQSGMNALTKGLWVEQHDVTSTSTPPILDSHNRTNNRMTLRAIWEPTTCRQRPIRPHIQASSIRIGSSTMPHPTLKVGDVYNPQSPSARKWIQFLEDRLHPILPKKVQEDEENRTTKFNEKKDNHNNNNNMSLTTTENNNVLIFSSGLHQILHGGYNVQATASQITRMLCQLAAVTPTTKMLLLGPVPIQQQLYSERDITDQNVQWLNAILRHAVRSGGDGAGDGDSSTTQNSNKTTRLADLCRNRNLTTFRNAANEHGDCIPYNDEGVINTTNSSTTMSLSPLLPEPSSDLLEAFASNEFLETIYGNRHVYFVEIQDFLRARPETYRLHDKIHDKKIMEGGDTLYSTEHNAMIEQLIQLRAMAVDP